MGIIHKNYVNILRVLRRNGYLKASKIATQVNVDKHNVYDYLDKLVKVGWVKKTKQGVLSSSANVYRLTKKGFIFLKIYKK